MALTVAVMTASGFVVPASVDTAGSSRYAIDILQAACLRLAFAPDRVPSWRFDARVAQQVVCEREWGQYANRLLVTVYTDVSRKKPWMPEA